MTADRSSLAAAVPTLLWVLLVMFVFLRLERPLRKHVLPRITGVGIAGLRVDIGRADVKRALRKPGFEIPAGASNSILKRIRRTDGLLRHAAILWADDEPARNSTERRFLHRIGTFVEIARTNDEALTALEWGPFDVIISNMQRDGLPDAGLRLIQTMRERRIDVPVILYVSSLRPGTPPDAFGITNRPDESYHLLLDALERRPPASYADGKQWA